MGDTVSAAELCFDEWWGLASGARTRCLWVDASVPRLCLLSACLHVRHQPSSNIRATLPGVRNAKKPNDFLLQDLELLGSEEIFTLPPFLNPETVFRARNCCQTYLVMPK